MVKGFWKTLSMSRSRLDRPILALAPMADVTDAAFRRIIAKYSKTKNGAPYITFTEFVSCDGLCSEGRKNLLPLLKFSKKEKPIVAQIFGAKPENFYESAKLIKKLGFDGIDINMGCPDKKVIKQSAGASLINNPRLAQKIILETKRGAGRLPVSVKTRIGYNRYDKKELKKWLIALLECEPAAITIHARTKKEMSLVPARWDIVAEAVKIRDEFCGSKPDKTLILGNGDVQSVAEAYEKAEQYGTDGVMIGRAVFGNPWLFAENRPCQEPAKPVTMAGRFSNAENFAVLPGCFHPGRSAKFSTRISVLLEHTKLFEKLNKNKNFDVMKKHFKSYVSGFIGAKELRIKLMACKNAKEVEVVLKNKRAPFSF